MANLTRAQGLVTLLHELMTNPRGVRVREFCERHDVNERTWRDWQRALTSEFGFLLDAQGEPLVRREGRGERARLVWGSDYAEVKLGATLRARIAATQLWKSRSACFGDVTLFDEARAVSCEAVRRLTALIDYDRMRSNLERKFVSVPAVSIDYTRHAEILDVLIRGVLSHTAVCVTFATSTSGVRTTTLEPLTLVDFSGALYLLARGFPTPTIRAYEVRRFRAASSTTRQFIYPSPVEFDPRHFIEAEIAPWATAR